MTRDRVRDDLANVAKRMSERYEWPVRARFVRTLRTTAEGLETHGPYHFEPVRERHRFRRQWQQSQSVAEAASRVGGLLRDGRRRLCPDCGHPEGFHPGRLRTVTRCAMCVADEDNDRISEDDMCARTYRPGDV